MGIVIILVCVIMLILALVYKDKINGMYKTVTAEELEVYQESVFLNIEDRISEYKRDMENFYNKNGHQMIKDMEDLILKMEESKNEFLEIEKRIDEKLIRLNEYKKLIK
ncbi:hypothetical protein ACSW8S_19430 (plasmid) [Clostridium perfringens]